MEWAPLLLSLEVAGLSMVLFARRGHGSSLLLDWKRMPHATSFSPLVSRRLVLPPTVLGYYLLVALGSDSVIGRAWHSITGGIRSCSRSPARSSDSAAVGFAAARRSLRIHIGLEAVDPNLENAAHALSALAARVLVTVVLPLATPAILAGAMLAFARALGDF